MDYIFVGKVLYGENAAIARHKSVIELATGIIDRTCSGGKIPGGKEAQAFYSRMAAEMYVEILASPLKATT